jgi:hypothetical protein
MTGSRHFSLSIRAASAFFSLAVETSSIATPLESQSALMEQEYM